MKDFTKYEFRQDLDKFEIGIGNYRSFQKGMLRDFNIQLNDSYLAEINRVDLLLAHDRGFIWNQEQSAQDHKDNWKERVQTLVYSYRILTNYINFFHFSTTFQRILTSSAYFSDLCTLLSRFKGEFKKNTTLSTSCSQPHMTE